MKFVLDATTFPPTCLPEDVYNERHTMMDVTGLADPYRVFLDPATGQMHRGATYALAAQQQAAEE